MLPTDGGKDEAVRQQAAVWFERMRGADAERYRAEFERWRRSDPEHANAYIRYEDHWALAGALRNTEMGHARQLTPKQRWSFALPSPRYAFAGAALIILLVVGSLFALNGASQPPQIALAGPPLSTPVGQIRQKHLDDGSTVTLDTDSLVEVAFSRSVRIVRLVRGRARFEVAHDAARPFIVEVAGRTVTARGTIFDVSLIGNGMKVSLLRGAIDVGSGTASQPISGPVARLKVGESFRAVAGKETPLVQPTLHGEEQWVAGMLTFDGASLSEVLDQTNRYSKIKIRIGDPALENLRVTGAFHPLPVDELAAALAAAFSLRVEHASNGDLVLQPR